MRKGHYITIVAALALIAAIYYGGNTKPPKKEETGVPLPMAQGNMNTGPAPAISIETILDKSKTDLPEHAKEEVNTLEAKAVSLKDSVEMAPVFTELARTWQQHKIYPPAGYYYATAAKLENSEKNLNFAGRFLMELLHTEEDPQIRSWAANEAITCFKRSLDLNPDNDTVKMALASCYVDGTGSPMQGIQLLLGITREKPDNVPANLMLGQLSIRSGQFDKAVERFEKVLKVEPENTEALYFLAEAYKNKGDKQKAIELLEKCKKIINKPEFSRDIDEYINSFK